MASQSRDASPSPSSAELIPATTVQVPAHPRQSTDDVTATHKRRKRDALSLREKARIIRILQQTGQSRRALARDLHVPPATMHSIWKNRQHILDMSNTLPDQSLDKVMRCRPPQYPELENRVYDFCLFVRSHRKRPTKSLIIAKARRIASQMGISGFGASSGWYSKFLRRRGLPTFATNPRSADKHQESIEEQMRILRHRLVDFNLDNIYTVHECHFLYQCLPNRHFLSTAHSQQPFNLHPNQPRVTFVVSANATGSHALPLVFIGKERHPVSFDLADSADAVAEQYFWHADACIDSNLFQQWLRSWYDIVRTTSSPPWALVLNESDVEEKLPSLPGVKYVRLPGRSSKIVQPLKNGVLSRIKNAARQHMLTSMRRALDAQNELLGVAKSLRPGAAGIVYGRKATLLDAMRFLTSGLRVLRNGDFATCWLKAGILPSEHERVLSEIHDHKPRDDVRERSELCEMFKKLNVAMKAHHLHRDIEEEFGSFDEFPPDGVDKWIGYLTHFEEEYGNVLDSLGGTQEEILAASEKAEREMRAQGRDVSTSADGVSVEPERPSRLHRMQAAHASSVKATKIVQNALNELSLHSTNHAVLGKLAEALRLATEDRNEKRARLDMLMSNGNAPT